MSVKKENEVRIERTLSQPASKVFQALAEGRLFNNCGGDFERMQLDFRTGGKYAVTFSNVDSTIRGHFVEIVTDKKIVFTWGDDGSSEGFPKNTRVSIELFAEGAKTRLVIHHTGFATQDDADAHQEGWCSGLDDLGAEMEYGRLRLVRTFSKSRDALYAICSNPRKFFESVAETTRGEADFRVGGQIRFPTENGEIRGAYEAIDPGKKIVFTWLNGCHGPLATASRVTLVFEDEDDGESSIELVHELLPTDEVKPHREGWEHLTNALRKT